MLIMFCKKIIRNENTLILRHAELMTSLNNLICTAMILKQLTVIIEKNSRFVWMESNEYEGVNLRSIKSYYFLTQKFYLKVYVSLNLVDGLYPGGVV